MLRRWQDEGQHESDLPLVRYCAEQGFATIEKRLDDVLLNLPLRAAGWVLRALVLPPVLRATPPSDKLTALCANILLEPSDTRDRLVGAVWEGHDSASVEQLERAFELLTGVQPLLDRIKHAGLKDWRVAHARGAITDEQANSLEAAEQAVAAVIEVDDFAPGDFDRQPV